jgi:hypothetical protein
MQKSYPKTLAHAHIHRKKKEKSEREAMSASNVDPHDKMRARDMNKVARGEQAPSS